MKIKQLLSSKLGFSIVEVTVAMGLLGALSLGVMKLMENSNKAAKNIENKDEISQLRLQISDTLNNPNNCESSLAGRTINSNVPIIYGIVGGVPTPKFIASNSDSNKVQVRSMRVKEIDANGDGSNALAVLEVEFKKPQNSIGGQYVKKDINLNANLCFKNIVPGATAQGVLSNCNGSGRKLIEGPHNWNGSFWGVCQDCTDISANQIRFCQSSGGGAGIDIGNVSQLSCVSLGGTFDESTSKCLFVGLTLEEFIQSKIDASMSTIAQNITDTSPVTCPASSSYSLAITNGKIKLQCTAPTGCSSCSAWSGWSLSATGCSGGHGGAEPYRTSCTYTKSCTNKLPTGCVGSIANESSGELTYTKSMGGNKYSKCDNAKGGTCPAPSSFGL